MPTHNSQAMMCVIGFSTRRCMFLTLVQKVSPILDHSSNAVSFVFRVYLIASWVLWKTIRAFERTTAKASENVQWNDEAQNVKSTFERMDDEVWKMAEGKKDTYHTLCESRQWHLVLFGPVARFLLIFFCTLHFLEYLVRSECTKTV